MSAVVSAIFDDATPGRGRAVLRVVALGMIVLVVMTGRLWLSPGVVPIVPWVPGAEVLAGPVVAPVVMVVWMAAWAAVAWTGGTGRRGRAACAAAVVVGLAAVAPDQARLQPWALQALWLAAAAAVAPGGVGVVAAGRVWMAGLYLHSGLSKLDRSFLTGTGRMIADGLPGGAGDAWGPAGVLLMPAGELLTATALVVPATRPAGVVLAGLLHGTLVLALGPWGLGHSVGVLVWNGVCLALDVFLFRPGPGVDPGVRPPPQTRSGPVSEPGAGRPVTSIAAVWVAGASVAVAGVMPLTERWGVWDPWPSFVLYGSHEPRIRLQVRREDVCLLPADWQAFAEVRDGGEWAEVAVGRASLELRGAPAYPGDRAGLAVAAAIVDGLPAGVRWRVLEYGPADRLTGERRRRDYGDPAGLRGRLAEFRLPARAIPAQDGGR